MMQIMMKVDHILVVYVAMVIKLQVYGLKVLKTILTVYFNYFRTSYVKLTCIDGVTTFIALGETSAGSVTYVCIILILSYINHYFV